MIAPTAGWRRFAISGERECWPHIHRVAGIRMAARCSPVLLALAAADRAAPTISPSPLRGRVVRPADARDPRRRHGDLAVRRPPGHHDPPGRGRRGAETRIAVRLRRPGPRPRRSERVHRPDAAGPVGHLHPGPDGPPTPPGSRSWTPRLRQCEVTAGDQCLCATGELRHHGLDLGPARHHRRADPAALERHPADLPAPVRLLRPRPRDRQGGAKRQALQPVVKAGRRGTPDWLFDGGLANNCPAEPQGAEAALPGRRRRPRLRAPADRRWTSADRPTRPTATTTGCC